MNTSTLYVVVGAVAGVWVGIIAFEIRHGGIIAAFIKGLRGQ
jgi:hypothetical protein